MIAADSILESRRIPMHSTSELRERYLQLRQVATELNHTVMKTLSRDDIGQAARDLGFERDGVLVFDHMDESAVLFDYCLYNVHRNGRNAFQRFLAECPPAEGSLERLVLEAECRAWYSIFVISKLVPEVGVEAEDMLHEESHLIADINMSRTNCVGGVLATRVIPFDGFVMTGGAALPLGGNDKEREKFLVSLRRVFFEQNITSLKQLTAEQDKELTRALIRAARAGGATSFIQYEAPGSVGGAGRARVPRREPVHVTASGRVGRNDPCPCGSGRKFKVCCLRSQR
jgi:hypothetical protein